jgi:predicted transposase YdaD
VALSEAFLAWEQQTQERIRQEVSQEERQEKRQVIALNMLQDNLPLEQISRLTGLTIAQVEELQPQAERN